MADMFDDLDVFDEIDPEESFSVWSDIGSGASRAAGVVVGAVNAPLAAVWGSLSPTETKEEQDIFTEKSVPERVLIRVGSGLKSAYDSIMKRGSFGKGYGDYYKATTGEEANPIAEFAVNALTDPVIVGGLAKGLARGGFNTLKELRNYIKTGKTPMPEAVYDAFGKSGVAIDDISRLTAIDDAEKQAARQELLDALQKRGIEKNFAAEVGGLSEQKALPPGQGFEIVGERPRGFELEARSRTIIPPDAHRLEAERLALEQRGGVGIPPERPIIEPSEEYAKHMAVREEWDKFHEFQGVAGGGLGFGEDEEGNITFDPAKAVAGMAGGVVLSKMFKNPKLQKELSSAPELSKVFDTIIKEKPSFSIAGIIPKINEQIFNRFAAIKDVSRQTYDKALSYSSHKDVAWMKFKELQDVMRPVSKAEDLMTGYVAARRMATRGARAIDNPGGITFDEATKAVSQAESTYVKRGGNVDDLRNAADGFNEWTRKYILQEARDSGLISKDTYAKILNDNDFYATFKILEKMPEDINKAVPSTGEYFSVGQQGVVKKMKGTERQMADPIKSTIEKFVQAQSVFERNKVASTFVDDPNAAALLMPVAKNAKEFTIMKAAGKNPVMEGSWSARDFDTINRFKDGRVEKYLAPKEISEAMKRLTPFQAPKWLGALNSIFRKSATTLYLPFTISNAMRDALMAYNTSPVYTGATDVVRFAKDWGRGLKEGFMYEFLGKSDLTEQYLKAGGGFGYSGEMRDAKLAKDSLFRGKVDVVKDSVNLFKLIDKISSAVELAPRLGVYSRAFEEFGTSATKAARLARSSTIDFSKGGVLTKATNQFVPFINARVQGWNNVRLALQKNPKATATKLFTSVVMPGVAAYAYNRHYYSDEYDDIPQYIKDNYFTFITGTEQDKEGKTVPKYFVIPKGDVGQLVMNPIEYAMDQAMKKDRDSVANFALNWVSDLSPVPIAREGELSASKALGSVTPPIVKGVVEGVFNKNLFTGRDIVPFSMENKPPDLQFKENTPETYKWLGEKTNISPLHIQNFMQNIFAGYGREGLDPSAMARGLAGRFVKTQGGEKESKAWDVVREIDKGYNNVRERAKDLIEKGQDDEAMAIMGAWNDGLVDNIDKIEKYGFEDKGGLYKQYMFSRNKMRNVLSGKELERGIENKLARKKSYKYRD